MLKTETRLIAIVGTILLTAAAPAGDDLTIDWWTVDGGGDMWTTGIDFELSGTIGQPDAGEMSGGTFTLTGGFWFALAAGDCNSDGVVDLYDYDDFEPCLSGPSGGLPMPACSCFDLDGDDDVDLSDAAQFQAEFMGE
jgi:hypothetical protein